MRTGLLLLLALACPAAASNSPEAAVEAAHADAAKLPPDDRPYARYSWWPDGWPHAALLAKSTPALLSSNGFIRTPVEVVRGTLFRYDARDYRWEQEPLGDPEAKTGLEVWEGFAETDFVFQVRWRFRASAALRVYSPVTYGRPPDGATWSPAGAYRDGRPYPAGYYRGDRLVARASAPQDSRRYLRPGWRDEEYSAGDSVYRPAPWADPMVAVEVGPFGAPGVTSAASELRRLTYSEAPVVFGPLFMVYTGRNIRPDNRVNVVGYYRWFGIKDRVTFFRYIGLDEKEGAERYQEWRADVEDSSISEQNRNILLQRARTGLVWGTLDTFTQKERGVLRRNLRRGEFDHDAEEWIGRKPDGLPLNVLIANKAVNGGKAGDVQDTAPDKVGGNKSALNVTNDLRIHTDGCWDCHGVKRDYLVSFDDHARATFRRGRAALVDSDYDSKRELEAAYLRDITRQVDSERREFAHAVATMTSTGPNDPGLTVAGFARIYREAVYRYLKPAGGVTAEVMAQELGVTEAVLIAGVRRTNDAKGGSDLVLGDVLTGGTLRRQSWEDSYQYGQVLALGYSIPELVITVKRKR